MREKEGDTEGIRIPRDVKGRETKRRTRGKGGECKKHRERRAKRAEESGRGRGETTSRGERVSRGLTLLALGIIRPAKEIGIARNSWEGVEFHMKYTRHLLPTPAGAPAKTQTHYK